MLDRIIIVFVTVLATLAIAGCSSVKVANKFNGQNISRSGAPVANIVSSNYGCYFVSWLPIVTGNSKDSSSWHLFEDTVTVDGAHSALIKKSSELGATKTVDVRSEEKWSADPITGCLLWTKEVEVSGNAVK